MRYLAKFNESTKPLPTTREEIIKLCNYYRIEDFTIDEEGLVSAPIVEFLHDDFKRLPLRFGKVDEFTVKYCPITTLEGFPKECSLLEIIGTEITSMTHCPQKFTRLGTRGTYIGLEENSKLASLEGSPDYIDYFVIKLCGIKSLKGAPQNIQFIFKVEECPIKNLIGGPRTVGIDYHIGECPLTSLTGAPSSVGYFEIESSRDDKGPYANITDPTPLRDLDFTDYIFFDGTPLDHLFQVFAQCGSKIFLESLDYNYIRGTNKKPMINLFRFKEALNEFGIDFNEIKFNMKSVPMEEMSPPVSRAYERVRERLGGKYPPHFQDLSRIRQYIKLGDYIWVDDKGRRVDFFGDLIN